ncbi:U4/U6 small nuclear ribonucleoprotein PRP31 [Acrasis kona]|uniref:U4/U6 small nuclear ribonucleoprotein PRP31 n=1 Tax=Acrasis kona TaxID=1008807 RepID=A0AAW2YYS1_9EUKA
MSTLADEFLADIAGPNLDDLNGGEVQEFETKDILKRSDNMEVDRNEKNEISLLEQKKALLDEHADKCDVFRQSGRQLIGGANLQDDVEYPFIIESNRIILDIDQDIGRLHTALKQLYNKKFPELETHVLNPTDYARVVKRIANTKNLTTVDMADILPVNVVMIVKVTASHSITSKTELNQQDLDETLRACDLMLSIDQLKKRILDYVSSRMSVVSPNLSAIVGTRIAAQLIGIAGGLSALSKLPATNIQGLGKSKKNFVGFGSKQESVRYVGFIGDCDIIHRTPPDLRVKAGRLITSKATLAARIDSCHQSSDGSAGLKLREEIEDCIRAWQEPPPAKQAKPLPVPDEVGQKKRRGGKKARRIKELTRTSEIQKKRNRLAFGADVAEDEYMNTGKGMGMLGQEGSGKIRLTPKETKGLISKKKLDAVHAGGSALSSGLYTPQGLKGSATLSSGTATQLRTGLASSLAFTPVQGIELENPLNAKKRLGTDDEKKQKYFSSSATFKKPKLMMPPPPKQSNHNDESSK